MAQLDDLPVELLLQVAGHLGCYDRRPRDRNNDLCSLALVAQKYRCVAQEVLYASLCGEKPHIYHEPNAIEVRDPRDRSGNIILQRRVEYQKENSPTRLVKLVRTLLERRDLADTVRELDVTLYQQHETHHSQSEDPDKSGIHSNFVDLCRAFISRISHPGLSITIKLSWIRAIQMGQEVATLGILLACISNLHGLTLSVYSSSEDRDPFDSEDEDYSKDGRQVFTTTSITLRHMFCYPYFPHLDLPTSMMIEVLHLMNLERLNTNSIISAPLVSLPRLRLLQFGEDALFDACFCQRGQPSPQSLMLKELVVEVNNEMLMPDKTIFAYDRGHFRSQFQHLERLQFRLALDTMVDDYHYSYIDKAIASYQALLLIGRLRTLETLIIDFAESYERTTNREWGEIILDYLSPMNSLADYTKLRRIVAPQEALFSVNSDFDVCKLPASVERIEIIDSTHAVNRFALHVLGNKLLFPSLKTIVLWSYQKPFQGHDCRLSNAGKYIWDDEDEGIDNDSEGEDDELWPLEGVEGDKFWTLDWDVEETIWVELVEVGIEVLWKTAKKQEWRDEL